MIKAGRRPRADASSANTPQPSDSEGGATADENAVDFEAYANAGVLDSNKKFGEKGRRIMVKLFKEYERLKAERCEWDV